MFLCIYEKKGKMYFNVVKKVTESFNITNEKMETVKLGYKDKIYSYKFNSFEDLKNLRPILERWNLRYLILKNRFHAVVQIKLVVMLMNNILYDVVIGEEEILSEDVPENSVDSKMYEVFNQGDVEDASKEFGSFDPKDFPDIF